MKISDNLEETVVAAPKASGKRLTLCSIVCIALLIQFTSLTLPTHALSQPTPGQPDLDVTIDVGAIHFRGEIAEFYILVSQSGIPVDAHVSTNLYHDGALLADLTSLLDYIDVGLLRIPYSIPMDATPGTYALVVDASYPGENNCLLGTGLKSFQLSETLSAWNAWLVDIRNDIASITTDIGLVKIDLDSIHATLINIDGKVATIQTDIGIVKTSLNNINATLTSINGTTATIQTTLGSLSTDIDSIGLRLTKIEGDVATINTNLGSIQGNITSIQGNLLNLTTVLGSTQFSMNKLNASIAQIENMLATVDTDVGQIKTSLASIDSRLVALEGSMATVQTSLGTIQTSIESINSRVMNLQGSMATLSTDLGDLNGTIIAIEGDIARIKTDIGDILISLRSPSGMISEPSLWWVQVGVIILATAIGGIYLLMKRRKNMQ